ncbi:heme-binding protein [bacterium]|nr:heme-binding protein [bacterium]
MIEILETTEDYNEVVILAKLYAQQVKVPLSGIVELWRAFDKWRTRIPKEKKEIIDQLTSTIEILRQQGKEELNRISQEKMAQRIRRKKGFILLEDALAAIEKVVQEAKKDISSRYGGPIAVVVMGVNFKVIAMEAMEEVMPISADLCVKKAYTALAGKEDTLEWEKEEKKGLDGRNFGDPNWVCFGGGVPVKKTNGQVIGAVGVSGRYSSKASISLQEGEEMQQLKSFPLQDHELAKIGAEYLEDLYK